jgi:allophanate hydrolase subunit 1
MIRLEPAGAEALLLVLAEQPDAHLAQRLALLAERIRGELGPLLTDLVPGWTSLLLHYDLSRTDHLQLAERLKPLLERWIEQPLNERAGRLHEIPILYNGEDLAEVARPCRLDIQQVIELHGTPEYRVGAIGFAPGWHRSQGHDHSQSSCARHHPRTMRRSSWA